LTCSSLWTFEADRRLELVAADGDEVWGLLPDEEGGAHLVRFTLHPLEGGLAGVGEDRGDGPGVSQNRSETELPEGVAGGG
jgi:hypothetical protein